jgi:hypothetical protein
VSSEDPAYRGRHEREPQDAEERPPAPGFLAEVRDAVSARTVGLVLGVLVLQLGFILSYAGAFHAPKPARIPVAVVAPPPVSAQAVGKINALPGSPLAATGADSAAAAAAAVRSGTKSAALIVDPRATRDTLLVASGGGAPVATAVEQVTQQAEAAQHRTVTLRDLVPLQPGDARGLTGFYVVIGWIVGGYLVAALLGVAKGARPANTRRAVIRLVAVAPYAVASGLGGVIIVDPVLHALRGSFLALWGLGVLLVYAAAAVTLAFQVLAGVLGIGLTVLVFVVLGNPSAGGAYQPSLLPPFWRALSGALPNGAGTDAVRRIVYFDGSGVAGNLLIICAWLVGGVLVALLASLRNDRRAARTDRASSAASELPVIVVP